MSNTPPYDASCNQSTDARFFIPSRQFVQSLKVGDLAPSAFGQWRMVTRIYAQQEDRNGKLFCCYYVENGQGSSMSNSVKEGELHRDASTSNQYTSARLDEIERAELAKHREREGKAIRATLEPHGPRQNVVVNFGPHCAHNQNSRLELLPTDAIELRNQLTNLLGYC